MFGNKKAQDDLGDVKEITEKTSVKTWVNSLLMHLYKESIGEFTLQTRDGIPSIPLRGEMPEGELDFGRIINRLKVMSGLDSIVFPEAKEGKIELVIGGVAYIAKTRFTDSAVNSTCQITITKKN